MGAIPPSAAIALSGPRRQDRGCLQLHSVQTMPLTLGPAFSEHDTEGGKPSLVMSEQLARRLWPDSDSVGQQLQLENKRTYNIVGVVGDVIQGSLFEPPRPAVYFSATQAMWGSMGWPSERQATLWLCRTRSAPG
jgi:hypothetical protein